MATLLKDMISFRGDKLFNGAVNVDWFVSNIQKSHEAAVCFVFHGPEYHGVDQKDLEVASDHHLQDTVNFTRSIMYRCYGIEDQPFTLAIAGYGTGKSHLALSLGMLLSHPVGNTANTILTNLEAADKSIGSEIRALVHEYNKPCLVVAINGMGNHDLTAEITRQMIEQIHSHKLETKVLDDLRPRFRNAATLVKMSNQSVIDDLLKELGKDSVDSILAPLEQHDESIYSQVHTFFSSRGMPIQAIGGESIKDIINTATREYCGNGKPFSKFVILFDEFGRYMEFATIRSSIAGSGVLQDLFEAIQTNSEKACFIGFIQFELNTYLQRISQEYRNDIKRYITRYQSAKKAYLSTNLETLFASLLEKINPDILNDWFDNEKERKISQEISKNLQSWFPLTRNHRLWREEESFHKMIRKGCWPLTPLATWLLVYLTAAGKHLQERSALTLLGEALNKTENIDLPFDGSWSLSPVDLWSDALQEELIASEEQGQQGAITSSYATVISRHGTKLSTNQKRILKAIVIASKLGLTVPNRSDANKAIAQIVRQSLDEVEFGLRQLQSEQNVIDWDESFKAYDILGDAVPKTQFLAFLRQRIASAYDEETKTMLFAGKAGEWCELLSDLECDFSEQNRITTREWRYQKVVTNLQFLETQLKVATDRWLAAMSVDEPRGTIIYCYVPQNENPGETKDRIRKHIKGIGRSKKQDDLPILVVLLCDEDGELGQALAEISILTDGLTDEDKARFGNLVPAHREKLRQEMESLIESMIKQRHYVVSFQLSDDSQRLAKVGSEVFSKIYSKPINFPFDGFTTAHGNAADTCQQLTSELLNGVLDYDNVMAKSIKVKNRAVQVLKESWEIFTRSGSITNRPGHTVLRKLAVRWDSEIDTKSTPLDIGEMIDEMILPPYGANIASAGLALGVFISPRVEKLLVMIGEESYTVSQWLQNTIFKGKFLDINALRGVKLLSAGEISSEWETLLDEWEQVLSHIEKVECLKRGIQLKKKILIPPAFQYRYAFLEQQSVQSNKELIKFDDEL